MSQSHAEPAAPMSGIIPLDKPAGLSSARVVGMVKRLLPRIGGARPKIGHAGTLDPFATGLLLLLIGKATRSCETLMDTPKQYDATLRLGATTATDDLESSPIPWPGAAPVEPAQIQAALPAFTGDILQRPPAYSALKIAGRRAYDLARAGADVQLPPRPVRVYRIELLHYAWPLLHLRIDCGRGTYIRSLARDLGQSLHTGAHLTTLRRTRVGPYTIDTAPTLAQLERDGPAIHLKSPPPREADGEKGRCPTA